MICINYMQAKQIIECITNCESIDTLSNVYLINEYVRGMPLNDYMRSLDP